MANITLLRRSSSFDSEQASYRITVEAKQAENITSKIFVKQRLKNLPKQNFDDSFVAVATPAQLEDFAEDAPNEGSSYYRTNKIDLVSRNADYLNSVYEDIVLETQKLCADVEALNALNNDGIYTITVDNIDVSEFSTTMDGDHTHYRVKLTSRPCGTNETYSGDTKQRVGSQDVALRGWLNDSSEAGYKFKYNIATDPVLSTIFPIGVDKVAYGHLVVNGVQIDGMKYTTTGIFWSDDTKGGCPWPVDWVSIGSPGADETQITIYAEFIA